MPTTSRTLSFKHHPACVRADCVTQPDTRAYTRHLVLLLHTGADVWLRRLARSFISLVDNARELQASIAADEQASWTCVWDKDTCMGWEKYGFVQMAGVDGMTQSLWLGQ